MSGGTNKQKKKWLNKYIINNMGNIMINKSGSYNSGEIAQVLWRIMQKLQKIFRYSNIANIKI